MSKLTPLDRRFKIGQVVPVWAEGGEHLKAEVLSAENVPTGGRPQRWHIRVRVLHGGGAFTECWLSAPGSEPGKAVVVLVDN